MNPFKWIKFRLSDLKFNLKMNFQRFCRGYADCDYWGFYDRFLYIVPLIIKDLRDYCHGSAECEYEEIESYSIDFIEYAKKEIEKGNHRAGYDTKEYSDWKFDLYDHFIRYKIILTRIAWCLEQADETVTDIENEYQKEFNKQYWGDDSDIEGNKFSFSKWFDKHSVVEKFDKKGKPMLHRIITNDVDEELKKKYWNRVEEIEKYRQERKDEAFDLMKKYFYTLWD